MVKIVFKVVSMFLLLAFMSSCSEHDYLNAIPKNSTALVSIDAKGLLEDGKDANRLSGLLGLPDSDGCGVDLSSKIYLFETLEGNIGLSAKVSDEEDLKGYFVGQAKKGYCKGVSEYEGFNFTVINDSWVVGFSSDVLLVMGPSLPAVQQETKRQIVKCLQQDEEQSITGTQMFEKLDSMGGTVAVIAQASALPEKFVAQFTLCAPKDADLSKVMIAAQFRTVGAGCIAIHGETFSFNKSLDEEIKRSSTIFNRIQGRYVRNVPDTVACGVFMNVKGDDFLKLLNANKTFQAILAGINTAIDMDNIVRCIDGDVALVSNSVNISENLQFAAQLKDKSFIKDIDYWKRSCPAGSCISDIGTDFYRYSNGDFSFYFGVSPDLQFYSGCNELSAKALLDRPETSMPSDVVDQIVGQRMVMLLNIRTLLGQSGNYENLFKALLGDTDKVLYIME